MAAGTDAAWAGACCGNGSSKRLGTGAGSGTEAASADGSGGSRSGDSGADASDTGYACIVSGSCGAVRVFARSESDGDSRSTSASTCAETDAQPSGDLRCHGFRRRPHDILCRQARRAITWLSGRRENRRIQADALNSHEVTFDWEGKTVKRRIEELVDKKALEAAPKRAGCRACEARRARDAAQHARACKDGSRRGPRREFASVRAGRYKPCGNGSGRIQKVTKKTPFGESCRWEAVN